MSETRSKVYAYTRQDRLVLNGCEVAADFAGSADVTAITNSTNHKEGALSVSFAKSGTTQAYGELSWTKPVARKINLIDFYDGKLRFFIYMSSVADLANVQLIVGEDSSNTAVYQFADTEFSAGWTEVTVAIDSPTSVTGDGAAWSSIAYIAIRVNFDSSANTLSGILIDGISALYESASQGAIDTSTLATSAKQDTMIASLSVMDDWDESDRIKANIIVGQAGVAAGAGAVGATVQRVTLASDDPAVASLSVLDDWDNAASNGVRVSGDVAHDSVDAGEPVGVGGVARTTNPSAVADGDRVKGWFSKTGKIVTASEAPRELVVHQHTQIASSSSETAILSAAAAGVYHDLVELVITNQTATAVNVTIKDDTGGTTRMIIALAPNGGAVIPFRVPLVQAVAQKPWTATLDSAAVTVNFLVQAIKTV